MCVVDGITLIGLQLAYQRAYQLPVPLVMVVYRLIDLDENAIELFVADFEHLTPHFLCGRASSSDATTTPSEGGIPSVGTFEKALLNY